MIPEISVAEVKTRIANGEKLNLLDVREPNEYAEAHIDGVILLPLGKVMSLQLDEIEDLRDSELIIVCRSGNRSGQATAFLQQLGYSNVKNMTGGMIEWNAAS